MSELNENDPMVHWLRELAYGDTFVVAVVQMQNMLQSPFFRQHLLWYATEETLQAIEKRKVPGLWDIYDRIKGE